MLLHITNDYTGSNVYKCLTEALTRQDVAQCIYTAFRDSKLIGRNRPVNCNEEMILQYSCILSNYTRINFFEKKRRIFKDLRQTIPIENISIVHAHTWYSDGSVAFKLYKKHGIPYVISVRDTDINLFLPYMLHLRSLGREIITNAKKIIFISSSHHKRLISSSHCKIIADQIRERGIVIPNGIDSFYLENLASQGIPHKPFRLIYVGKFDPRKNVTTLMKAVGKANSESKNIEFHLTLVGGDGKDTAAIKKLISKYPNQFEFVGRISEVSMLSDLYRSCDAFVMPSLTETFGLVYVEALSQGLPILYSRGEGVDGFFDEKYGYSCNPKSIDSIAEGILKLRDTYSSFQIDQERLKREFSWDLIAKKYINEVYKP